MLKLLDMLCPYWRQQNPLRPDDKNNSFSANNDGWRDHGADHSGDQITFIQRFEGLSRGDAIRRFLELSNGIQPNQNGASTSKQSSYQYTSPPDSIDRKGNGHSTAPVDVDWPGCVAAFTQDKALELSEYRGYSMPFIEWLKDFGLVGIYRGQFALPIHDDAGGVVGIHHKHEDGKWRTVGKTRPLIIGDRESSKWLVFESQWDAFAVMDTQKFHHLDDPGYSVLITRGSANGKFTSIIPGDTEATVVMQNDPAAEKWLEVVKSDCKARLSVARPPAEVKDFNDWLRRGDADFSLMARDAEKMPASSGYSIACFDDITSWEFCDEDIWFGDKLIEPGKNMALLGPPGVGKSRWLLQFAMHAMCGVDFLGQSTARMYGKKWLFFQTENSRRRLKTDVEKITSNLFCLAADQFESEKIRAAIKSCLRMTYFGHDRDASMSFDNPQDVIAMRKALDSENPDFVVFDPLNDKAIGDLNKDHDMRATINAMTSVARHGNSQRVICVVHHSLTGKQGAAKSVGWEAGSYGRNSKALNMWIRSQINISPASGDDNCELVISCGKVSDGSPFEPYGATFEKRAGVYVRNEDFRLDDFKEEVGITVKKSDVPQKVLSLVGSSGITKEDLAKGLMQKFETPQTTAYRWIKKATDSKVICEKKGSYFPNTYTR